MKKKRRNRCAGWLLCGAALLLAACGKDDALQLQGGHALELEAVTLDETGSAVTRTLMTATELEKVGIYVTTAGHGEYPSNPRSVYSLSGTTWSADNPPQITTGNGDAQVYAYSPAGLVVTNSADGKHTVPVNVVTTDDFLATAQTDYLLTGKYVKGQTQGNGLQAAPIAASATKRSLSIPLVHALAKVSLRVIKSEAATEKLTLKKVELLSPTYRIQAGSGTMNLQDGKLGLQSTSKLTLNGEAVLTSGSSQQPNVTCLVAPMNGEEQLLSFRLTVNVQTETGGTGTDLIFETGTVGTPQKWEACKHYIYKVKVDKMGGGLSGVQMDEWQNDASQNTDIGI